jgi:peroxiredoxin
LKILTENYSEIADRNVKLISIAIDSQRKLALLKERYHSPIQFIADRGAKITKSYNVYLEKEHPDHDHFQVNHAIPSKFLINNDGIIVWNYVGKKEDRPSIEQIINAIEKYL